MNIAIIGAGPAGLAALATLSKLSYLNIFLFDAGKSLDHRNHETAADLGIGVGGAGLFSDGKFSFYPSGTQIYKLKDQYIINEGHRWMCNELEKSGIQGFPLLRNQADLTNDFLVKDYPSAYGDLAQRKKLIANMANASNGKIFVHTKVTRIKKINGKYNIYYTNDDNSDYLCVDAIILATGRLGNLFIPDLLPDLTITNQCLRYEMGVRIETPADIGFLSRKKTPDVKAIWKESFGEIRTFCTCRNGEIWNIPYENLSAISGRSDGPRTDYSNFGLLLRFTGSHFLEGKKYFNQILQSEVIKNGEVAYQPLSDFIQHRTSYLENNFHLVRPWFPENKFKHHSINQLVGNDMHKMFCLAIERLLEWSPDLLSPESMVLFPAIEGTGIYPSLTPELQIEGEAIWCSGDLVGKFRGIIPAFLSGYYAARRVLESHKIAFDKSA